MVLADGSRFSIEPDPPVAGETATVTYVGPADSVEWQVDGEDGVSVDPDKDGNFVIDPVPSGGELVLSDQQGAPGYLHRYIVSTEGK